MTFISRVPFLNAAQRSLASMFPGFYTGIGSPKHNFARDFGYPDDVNFASAYAMYCRNGLARAGCRKTAEKTWRDNPEIVFGGEGAEQIDDLTRAFERLRFWQCVSRADLRSLVGGYSGIILRIADNGRFIDPVKTSEGLDGLVEIIPAWAGQLEVSEWDDDETSPTYGQPRMFQFNEAAVGSQKRPRSFQLHPHRVVVWSEDGTVDARSALEPGYNALLDMEKISGAGGEGFWKNAKSAPVLEIDPKARLTDMAKAMGTDEDKLVDAMNDQVEDWQKGFDQLLMLQGMQAKTLGVNLPSPEHFFAVSLQFFAASMSMPLKILVGTQTGERASSEDAKDWAQTINSRRQNETLPNIMQLIGHLTRIGIMDDRDWTARWSDLTEAGPAERIENAKGMTEVNRNADQANDMPVFSVEEVRLAAGYDGPGPDIEIDEEDEGI